MFQKSENRATSKATIKALKVALNKFLPKGVWSSVNINWTRDKSLELQYSKR